MACSSWILRMYEHARILATCVPLDYLLPCRQQFWNKISEKTCELFNKLFEREIQTYQRMGWRLILQHITHVGLCGTTALYFYAGVYQKAIVEIQTHNAVKTTLPLLTRAEKIWHRCTIPLPQRQYSKTHQ